MGILKKLMDSLHGKGAKVLVPITWSISTAKGFLSKYNGRKRLTGLFAAAALALFVSGFAGSASAQHTIAMTKGDETANTFKLNLTAAIHTGAQQYCITVMIDDPNNVIESIVSTNSTYNTNYGSVVQGNVVYIVSLLSSSNVANVRTSELLVTRKTGVNGNVSLTLMNGTGICPISGTLAALATNPMNPTWATTPYTAGDVTKADSSIVENDPVPHNFGAVLPTVTVTSAYQSVVPGSAIEFTATAVPKPVTGQTLAVTIAASDSVSNSLTITPLNSDSKLVIDSSGSATGVVTTSASATGNLTLSATAESGVYTAGTNKTIPFTANTASTEITIAGPATAVNDGGNVEFTVAVSENSSAPTADLAVKVNVANHRNTGYVAEEVHYVRIPATQTSGTFSIPTVDKSNLDSDGVVSATVQANGGYSGTPVAYADIYENEGTGTSTVTVVSNSTGDTVVEGQNAQFKFIRNGGRLSEKLKVFFEEITKDGTNVTRVNNEVEFDVNATESEIVNVATSPTSTKMMGDGVTVRVKSLREDANVMYRLGSTSSVTVAVTESVPVSTVTIDSAYQSVVPGGEIEFTATAVPAPAAGQTLEVAILASDSGNNSLTVSPLNSSSKLVIDSSGSATGVVSTSTGATGNLTLAVTPESGVYLAGTDKVIPFTANTASTEISLEGPDTAVNDGRNAEFTVAVSENNQAPTADLAVKVSVANYRNTGYVTEEVRYVRIPATQTSGTLTIPIIERAETETDGVVSVTVQTNAGYTGSPVAYADVHENEGTAPPIVTVSSESTGDTVVEGNNAQFKFHSNTNVAQALTVYYEVMEEGEVTAAADGTWTIPQNTMESEVLNILTTDTTMKTSGNGVTIRVKNLRDEAGVRYRVGDPASAEVEVTEMGTIPVVTIDSDYRIVVPGSEIEFTATAVPAPGTGETLEVAISASDSGGSSLTVSPLDSNSKLVIDSSGTATAVVATSTGATGNLTLSVTAESGVYTAGTDKTVAYLGNTASTDMTIEGLPATVNDGDDIVFTLTASEGPTVDLAVKVSVANHRNTGYVTEDVHYVQIPATQTTGTLRIPTVDRANTETDGVVSATVQTNAGYTGTPVAYVDVHENEGTAPPIVTVSSESSGNTVVEGSNAQFKFHSNANVTTALTVYYEVMEEGEVTAATDGTHMIPQGMMESEILNILTTDTTMKTSGHGVTIRVKSLRDEAGVTYRVGSQSSAEVLVSEMGTIPTVTIDSEYQNLVPGSTIEFTATAAPAPASGQTLEVAITAMDSGSNNLTVSPLDSNSKLVIDSSGKATGIVTTSTGATGDLTLSVTAESGVYMAGTAKTIRFAANTASSEITITGPSAAVDDGDDAVFTVAVSEDSQAPTADLAVKVSVANYRNTGYVAEEVHYVRIPATQTTGTLTISTLDRANTESDGVVTATVQTNAGYTGTPVAYADVYEDEGTAPPIVTVSSESTGNTVVEGSNAQFKFQSGANVGQALTVYYEVMEEGEVTAATDGTWMIPASMMESTVLNILTTDTTQKEMGDGVTIRVKGLRDEAGVSYRVGASASATVAVTETVVIPTVTIDSAYQSLVPGSEIEFTATAVPPPSSGQTLEVAITASDSGSSSFTVSPLDSNSKLVIDSSGSATGVVSTSANATGNLTLAVMEESGVYMAGTDKTIAFTANTANTEIRIETANAAVNDGGTAEFTLRVVPTPTADLAVKVSVANYRNSGYVTEGVHYVRIPAMQLTETFSIETIEKAATETDGVVSATVQTNAGYAGTPVSYVDVYENEGTAPPIVTVFSESPMGTVTEGANAQFRFRRDATAAQALTVFYEVIEDGDVTDAADGSWTIPEDKTESEVLDILTTLTTVKMSGNGVTLRIKGLIDEAGAVYRVGNPTSATVAVTERVSNLPIVSLNGMDEHMVVNAVTDGATEGYWFEFTVTSNKPAPADGLAVSYTATGAGVLAADVADSVTIPRGMMQATARVNLSGDISVATNVTVALAADSANYQFESPTPPEIMIPVKDNENPIAAMPRLTIATHTDNATSVEEGTAAKFTVTAFPDRSGVAGTLEVNYAVAAQGGFLTTGQAARAPVVMANGMTTVDISIPTKADIPDGADGSVTITLLDGAGYTLPDMMTDAVASVTVTDPAVVILPDVTIASDAHGNPGFGVTEGHVFDYGVSRTGNTGNPLAVSVTATVTGTGSTGAAVLTAVLSSGATRAMTSGQAFDIIIPAGESTAKQTIRVEVEVDATNTVSVDVALTSDPAPTLYNIGSASSIAVNVKDNDNPTDAEPRLAIADPSELVRADENESAVFTITATPAPAGNITVRYVVSQTGNFIDPLSSHSTGAMTRAVQTISTNTARTEIRIPTADPDSGVDNTDGIITVTLQDGISYVLPDGTNHMAQANIIDTDTTTVSEEISIAKVRDIEEGEDAVFAIASNLTDDTEVRISVAQTSSHIFTPVPNTVTLDDGRFTLRIPTQDNRLNDDGSSITVTVLANTAEGYTIAGDGTARVDINDNDTNEPDTSPQYSVAASVITEILLQIPPTSNAEPKQNRPVIAIKADSASIEEGSLAEFTLTSSRIVDEDIAVNIKLSGEGDYINGATRVSAVIRSGTASAAFSVATADDDKAERDGTIRAEIDYGADYVAGEESAATVRVTDANDRQDRLELLDQANLNTMAQIAGSLGSHSLNTATLRVSQAFAESNSPALELGGNSTMADLLNAGVKSIDGNTQSWQELLGDSSFEIGLFPEEGTVNLVTVWGLGNHRSLDENELLEGDAFTGQLGFDATLTDGVVAGLATAVSQFDMEHGSGNSLLTYQIRTTGAHPYVGLESANGDRLQLIAGYGLGEIELDQNGYETEILDSSFFNFGLAGEMNLYSSGSILEGGASGLSITGEAWKAGLYADGRSDATSDVRADGRHLRLSVVGTHEQRLASGATVIPEVALGLREDGRKQQSFLGMEMGGGLGYTSNHGYRVSSNGEMLLSDASKIQEWGVAGQLTYDSFGDGLGVLLDFAPAWGQTGKTSDNGLWSRSILDHEFDSLTHTNGSKISAEIGYGISVWDKSNVLTPYGGIELTQNEDDEIWLGSKLRIGTDIQIELAGSRVYQSSGAIENELSIESSMKW